MIAPAALAVMARTEAERHARLMGYLGAPIALAPFAAADESEPRCRLAHTHRRRDGRECPAELCWAFTSREVLA